jgi:hypothetical protein
MVAVSRTTRQRLRSWASAQHVHAGRTRGSADEDQTPQVRPRFDQRLLAVAAARHHPEVAVAFEQPLQPVQDDLVVIGQCDTDRHG